ncbi:MAG: hypothetical protein KDE27_12900 [Planctomycetes bacterium]|nr:hypothetical protein [Planctomycetota bacterium]
MSLDAVTAELLGGGPYARSEAPYRLLRVRGRDAGDFLQRLCSQDVLGLSGGECAPAAFLDAKGKLLVTCAVQRADDGFWLETRDEQHERLAELLERYHFAEQVEFDGPADWACSEAIGREVVDSAAAVTFRLRRHGVAFTRAHGPAAGLAPLAGAALADELAECLRMAAGFVRVGRESEPTTLALEADLEDHCSTTKGCYTGQEIVARIHTYGHTNRKLCLLQLAAGPAITAPAPLCEPEDDVPVGRVMHAVPVPGHALRFGLGYLPGDFQAPGSALRLADGAAVTVVR